jgi:DNA-binding CsgD family transcriptional regulator
MTVSGREPEASTDSRKRADEQITEWYPKYFKALCAYLRFQLKQDHQSFAEDLAQEVFISVWQDIAAGELEVVRSPYGLMKFFGRQKVAEYYQSKVRAHSTAIDFGDPANTSVIGAGHGYALEVPELAAISRELDEAMDHMTAASADWRRKHNHIHMVRRSLEDGFQAARGGLSTPRRKEAEEEVGRLDEEERDALRVFRAACFNVGQLRAEIEAAAGPNWNSSAGAPASAAHRSIKKGSHYRDLSVTHCPEGHLLSLNNTQFAEDGKRYCRACNRATAEKRQEATVKTRPAEGTFTIDAETIEKARRSLSLDEVQSVRQIALALNISESTIKRYLPDDVKAFKRRQEAAFAERCGAARSALLDPTQARLSVLAISRAAGISPTCIYRMLPAEVETHRRMKEAQVAAS